MDLQTATPMQWCHLYVSIFRGKKPVSVRIELPYRCSISSDICTKIDWTISMVSFAFDESLILIDAFDMMTVMRYLLVFWSGVGVLDLSSLSRCHSGLLICVVTPFIPEDVGRGAHVRPLYHKNIYLKNSTYYVKVRHLSSKKIQGALTYVQNGDFIDYRCKSSYLITCIYVQYVLLKSHSRY